MGQVDQGGRHQSRRLAGAQRSVSCRSASYTRAGASSRMNATAHATCSLCRDPFLARITDERIVADRLDRSEVAMRDPFRAVEFGDVVRAGAERHINDLA